MTDIRMFDTPVDFDLAHQLLLGSTLGQTRFLDDFRSMYESSIGVNEFIALGETTLAKELSFNISADADFSAIRLFEFFFDYRLATTGLNNLPVATRMR